MRLPVPSSGLTEMWLYSGVFVFRAPGTVLMLKLAAKWSSEPVPLAFVTLGENTQSPKLPLV